jgi:hypothetical protein
VTTEHFEDNPFFVLELPISATLIDIDRTGRKLIAQLTIGALSAQRYASPFGTRTRDESKVRSAMATLGDPAERALCRFWAQGAVMREASPAPPAWSSAFEAIHWRAECTVE